MATKGNIANKRNAALRGERVSIKNLQRLMDYKSRSAAYRMLLKIRDHVELPPKAPVMVDHVVSFTKLSRDRVLTALAS